MKPTPQICIWCELTCELKKFGLHGFKLTADQSLTTRGTCVAPEPAIYRNDPGTEPARSQGRAVVNRPEITPECCNESKEDRVHQEIS